MKRLRWITAVLVAAATATTIWMLTTRAEFLDLGVYRWAAQALDANASLYDMAQPVTGLRFTYPPFAALLFWLAEPLQLLTPIIWTIGSLLAAGRMSWLVARAARVPWAALAILALFIVIEPSQETLRLGQINFFLGWLILEDLLGPRRRWSGALVGLAAAIKLTPAIFIVYLAVTGRWRAAIVALATIALTIAIGFAALPTESRDFWGGAAFDAGRVGAPEMVGNQSIDGVLWRLLETEHQLTWLLLAGAVALGCLALARRAHRVGDELIAVGLVALAGLFASPVSWTHHWVLALPLLVALWFASRRRRAARGIVAAAYLVLGSRLLWRLPHEGGLEFAYTPAQQLVASAYVLVGAALLTAAWLVRPQLGVIGARSDS
ncbi:MAG: hypothetical protein JWM90_1638 [Thermoleophilia bacterium]|nr:hypothetical protein [Thermoleophilia bacterium]